LTVVTGNAAALIHRPKSRRVGEDRELTEQIEDPLELLHGKWKVRRAAAVRGSGRTDGEE
jgi:hypothetical protein